MGGDQGLDRVHEKVDSQAISPGFAFRRSFRALEQAAVDQQTVLGIHLQLVTGAGDALMGEIGVNHVLYLC
ncbi:hypothetical protein D3C84_1063480 [compost metagenome]